MSFGWARRAVVGVLLCAVAAGAAAAPYRFTTQGRVVDATGAPLNGASNVVFAIYAASSGGTALWSESRTVNLDDGYYAVELGSVTAFPEDLFTGASLYLGVTVGSAAELAPRTQLLTVPMARSAQGLEVAASPPVACTATSHRGRAYFDTTLQAFRGCDGSGWSSLGGVPTGVPSGGNGTPANPGRSCLDIHQAYPLLTNGLYWIDPDGDGTQTQVQCEMTRDGGGWTFGVKNWNGAGVGGQQGAIGDVSNALTLKGAGYKLSDQTIRDIIGPTANFDIMMDQAGHNSAYSTGNYEYVILKNYTAWWTFGSSVAESTTETTMYSYRASDNALAWTGFLGCGPSGYSQSGHGVNCYNINVGTSPGGGSGCNPSMGTTTATQWHDFAMGRLDQDTYLYICNGAQHSSSHNMNHRVWFRERNPPSTITIGTQQNPGRTCKSIKTAAPNSRDGVYWIDPESDGNPIQAQCDMTRAGGGWTFGVKNWNNAGLAGTTGAVGNVLEAMTLKGPLYKLSDNDINDIIGPSQNFDLMADQAGYNTAYSSGNHEYVVIENYTAPFTFGGPTAASSTTTTFRSYRRRDGAVAWTGNLTCGAVTSAGHGINCNPVVSNNPQGGAGCAINLGSSTAAQWHDFNMGRSDGDTYLYICNGAQHSSGHNMNHRFWFRERN
jgi:hypothetical protein